MSRYVSNATQQVLARYGYDVCAKAAEMNAQGISYDAMLMQLTPEAGKVVVRTTKQLESAIAAGNELAKARVQEAEAQKQRAIRDEEARVRGEQAYQERLAERNAETAALLAQYTELKRRSFAVKDEGELSVKEQLFVELGGMWDDSQRHLSAFAREFAVSPLRASQSNGAMEQSALEWVCRDLMKELNKDGVDAAAYMTDLVASFNRDGLHFAKYFRPGYDADRGFEVAAKLKVAEKVEFLLRWNARKVAEKSA